MGAEPAVALSERQRIFVEDVSGRHRAVGGRCAFFEVVVVGDGDGKWEEESGVVGIGMVAAFAVLCGFSEEDNTMGKIV